MSPTEVPLGTSRVVRGRYPPPGTDPHADAIRERRGARGITPLDANLLHVPPIAGGFNSLLGAVRTKGNLPGDLREAMILRVAALNHATFEWIHHETVGRNEGLSTGQLYIIRDTETPLVPVQTVLNPLLTAAIAFTDHSTRGVRVPMDIILELKKQIRAWVADKSTSLTAEEINAKTDDLYVESAMVVASYNMVSRFLLATDVAGISDVEVPWPVEKKEHFISLPSFPPAVEPTHTIHAVTLITAPSAPWLVFANSLLTDLTMWNYVVPYFLDLSSPSSASGTKSAYNILLHSQRGHGLSTLPSLSDPRKPLVTIPLLATDIKYLLAELSIPTPVHSIIGVSQGGAAALAFAALHGGADGTPAKTKSIIACDTGPRTPSGNRAAWVDRIQIVYSSYDSLNASSDIVAYAKRAGMSKLAKITVPRWFPPGSVLSSGENGGDKKARWVEEMIERTDIKGFVYGALALSDYDLNTPLVSDSEITNNATSRLFESCVANVLLVAGSLDGDGKVGKGLQDLRTEWNEELQRRREAGKDPQISLIHPVEYLELDNSGHLPMIDSPRNFCEKVGQWLYSI